MAYSRLAIWWTWLAVSARGAIAGCWREWILRIPLIWMSLLQQRCRCRRTRLCQGNLSVKIEMRKCKSEKEKVFRRDVPSLGGDVGLKVEVRCSGRRQGAVAGGAQTVTGSDFQGSDGEAAGDGRIDARTRTYSEAPLQRVGTSSSS